MGASQLTTYDQAERAYGIYVSAMRSRGIRISRPWQALLIEEADDWVKWASGEKPYYLVLSPQISEQIRSTLAHG